jgi:hypothetical protein
MRARPILVALLAVGCAASWAVDQATIERDRYYQKRAQELTSELLGQLLRVHLEQLDENGMADTPLYADLKGMSQRVDEVASQMMPQVVDLLTRAAEATPERRKELLPEAQKRMHGILLKLLAERERLRMRRQHVELVDRLGEVLTKQQRTHTSTLILRPSDEQGMLGVLESQKAVGSLYGSFAEAVKQAAAWPGELGAGALRAGQLLVQRKVHQSIDAATRHLGAAAMVDAARSQREAIESLEIVMRELRGLEDKLGPAGDAMQAVARVRQLQERVRGDIEKSPFAEKDREQLLGPQTQVRNELAKIGTAAGWDDRATALLRRASASASSAREAIFGGTRDTAMDESGKVIAALTELEKDLAKGDRALVGGLTADEYAKLYEKLAASQRELEGKLAQLPRDGDTSRPTTKPSDTLAGAGKMLDRLAKDSNLPKGLATRLRGASDEIDLAARAAKDESSRGAEAVRQGEMALRGAIGELAEAGEEARRNALATKIGELNRAAEALARAEATMRDMARRAATNPSSPELEPGRREAEKIEKIAAKLLGGLENTFDGAIPDLKLIQAQAANVKNIPSTRPAASRPASGPSLGGDFKEQTEVLANLLRELSGKMRKEMAGTADKLEEAVGAGLGSTTRLQDDLQRLLQGASNRKLTADEVQKVARDVLMKVPSIGTLVANAARQIGEGKIPENDIRRAGVIAQIKKEDLESLLKAVRELKEQIRLQKESADAIAGFGSELAHQLALNDPINAKLENEIKAKLAQDIQDRGDVKREKIITGKPDVPPGLVQVLPDGLNKTQMNRQADIDARHKRDDDVRIAMKSDRKEDTFEKKEADPFQLPPRPGRVPVETTLDSKARVDAQTDTKNREQRNIENAADIKKHSVDQGPRIKPGPQDTTPRPTLPPVRNEISREKDEKLRQKTDNQTTSNIKNDTKSDINRQVTRTGEAQGPEADEKDQKAGGLNVDKSRKQSDIDMERINRGQNNVTRTNETKVNEDTQIVNIDAARGRPERKDDLVVDHSADSESTTIDKKREVEMDQEITGTVVTKRDMRRETKVNKGEPYTGPTKQEMGEAKLAEAPPQRPPLATDDRQATDEKTQIKGKKDISRTTEERSDEKEESTAKTPTDVPKRQPKIQALVELLGKKMRDHSESLKMTGRIVQDVTRTSELANTNIRDAAQIATALGRPQGDAGQSGVGGDDLSGLGAAPGGPRGAAAGAQGAAQAGAAGQGAMPGAGTPMGTGMTSGSPMGTAAMMAAGAAGNQGAAAAGAQAGEGQGQGQGQGAGGTAGQAAQAQGTSAGGSGGGSSGPDQEAKENAPRQQGQGQYTETKSGADSRSPDKRMGDAQVKKDDPDDKKPKDPWFTSLPRGVRDSMGSSGKKPLPRGYEDRLKKYFENQE